MQGFAQDALIPYRVKDKWGYASLDGTLRIPAQYDRCELFQNGYAAVNKGSMVGAINAKNEVVVPFDYFMIYFPVPAERRYPRANNYAVVATRDNRYGVYDIVSQRLILDTVYSGVDNQAGTLFTVEKKRHEKGVFDVSSRQWIAEAIYYEADPVSDTIVKVEKDGKEFVIPVRDGKPGPMSDWAVASLSPVPPPPAPGTWEEKGEVVDVNGLPSRSKPAVPRLTFKEQLIRKDGRYGFRFNAPFAGDVIPAIYDSIDCANGSESEGLMAVKKKGKWGVVNTKNAVVLPFIYEGLDMTRGDHRNGFFVIVSNGKKSIIDRKGIVLASGLDDIYLTGAGFVLTAGEDHGVLFTVEGTQPLLVKPQFYIVITPSKEVPLGNGKSIHVIDVVANNKARSRGYLASTGRLFFED
ncbi:WG repeat-containing protein [Chitinophaga sp. S165]|uniref:WG repeat-containing protein n=1 Tax=Chitinophaga sp. S165 TaxID=2135462 RepID=UPI001304CF96|nr:WG repeat-containing protein [Chitinophaga sp. S165]